MRPSRPLLVSGALGLLLLPAAGLPAYSAPDEPVDHGRMILVLDSSGSMKEPAAGGATKIESAREALTSVVDGLPEGAEVGLRVFGATVFSRTEPGACTDSQLVVAPGADNRDDLRDAVAEYRPFGETPIAHALEQAAKDLGGRGKRSIVLVSDGVATCRPDPCEVARRLAEQGIDLSIDVVGLGVDGAARRQLRCIAAAGHGRYYDAETATEITESLATVSERALHPFEMDGEPVRGGPTPADAGEVGAGLSVDTYAPGDGPQLWYRYPRTMAGSTVIVSATEMVSGLYAHTFAAASVQGAGSCQGGPRPVIHPVFTGYAHVVGPDPAESDDPCGTGDVLLELSRRQADAGPFEVGLAVWEEPPVVNADALSPAVDSDGEFTVPDRSGEPVEVTPGSTFADAAELESGQTYGATIVPGEVQAFKVHVGWGQQLNVRVDRPATPSSVGLSQGSDRYHLQVLNPVRASVDDSPEGVPGDAVDTVSSEPGTQYVGTAPVRWHNRSGSSPAYLAGDYYLVQHADFEGDGVELPYTLTAEVTGEETGVPEYADGQQVLGTGTADRESPAPSPQAQGPAAESPAAEAGAGEARPWLVGGGLGLVAVLVGAGVLAVRRGRSDT